MLICSPSRLLESFPEYNLQCQHHLSTVLQICSCCETKNGSSCTALPMDTVHSSTLADSQSIDQKTVENALQQNSLWMNEHFQKRRLITDPCSFVAKHVVDEYKKAVDERVRDTLSGKRRLMVDPRCSLLQADPCALLKSAFVEERCTGERLVRLIVESMIHDCRPTSCTNSM